MSFTIGLMNLLSLYSHIFQNILFLVGKENSFENGKIRQIQTQRSTNRDFKQSHMKQTRHSRSKVKFYSCDMHITTICPRKIFWVGPIYEHSMRCI